MSTVGRVILFFITVVVAAACSGLGVWQLTRLAERRARNAASIAQRDLPTIDLDRSVVPGDLAFRRVVASGRYDEDHQFLIRGRLLEGTPGIQIVTPFRLPGRDTAILVNRGFVPTADAGAPAEPMAFPEPGDIVLQGIARPVPNDGDGDRLETNHGETWHRLDLTAMRSRLPYPIASYYVIAGVDSAAGPAHTAQGRVLPIRIDPPALNDGPHLSYAVQWFMIAAASLGFGIVFVWKGAQPAVRVPRAGADRASG